MSSKRNRDWTPRPGELVQIWDDYQKGPDSESDENIGCIEGHGQVGYIVKIINLKTRFDKRGPADFCCEIICFGQDPNSRRVRVHADWLIPLRDPSDIRKVEINL